MRRLLVVLRQPRRPYGLDASLPAGWRQLAVVEPGKPGDGVASAALRLDDAV